MPFLMTYDVLSETALSRPRQPPIPLSAEADSPSGVLMGSSVAGTGRQRRHHGRRLYQRPIQATSAPYGRPLGSGCQEVSVIVPDPFAAPEKQERQRGGRHAAAPLARRRRPRGYRTLSTTLASGRPERRALGNAGARAWARRLSHLPVRKGGSPRRAVLSAVVAASPVPRGRDGGFLVVRGRPEVLTLAPSP
jgi:hypothetical protein